MRLINENVFFKKFRNFITGSLEEVLIELFHNSRRASAEYVKVEVDVLEKTLVYQDDGVGIDNITPVLVLSDSGWPNEIKEFEDPAGWGLYYLFGISNYVIIKSKFGRLEFNPPKYFEDETYRNRFISLLSGEEGDYSDIFDPNDKYLNGVSIKARMVNSVFESNFGYIIEDVTKHDRTFRDCYSSFTKSIVGGMWGFDIELIYISKDGFQYSKIFKRKSFEDFADIYNHYIEVKGYPFRFRFLDYPPSSCVTICWLGQFIDFYDFRLHNVRIDGILVITPELLKKNGPVLTPVLPFRNQIKADELKDSFVSELINKLIFYAENLLKDVKSPNRDDAAKLLRIFGKDDIIAKYGVLGTQGYFSREGSIRSKYFFENSLLKDGFTAVDPSGYGLIIVPMKKEERIVFSDSPRSLVIKSVRYCRCLEETYLPSFNEEIRICENLHLLLVNGEKVPCVVVVDSGIVYLDSDHLGEISVFIENIYEVLDDEDKGSYDSFEIEMEQLIESFQKQAVGLKPYIKLYTFVVEVMRISWDNVKWIKFDLSKEMVILKTKSGETIKRKYVG